MKPKVFVGSSSKSLNVAHELPLLLNDVASVMVWKHLFELSNYTLESLIKYSKEYDFGVFVFGADDMIEMNGEKILAARDNVVFELGLFVGRLGRDRNFLVTQTVPQKLHLPADLEGLTVAPFDLELAPGQAIADAPLMDIKAALVPACSRIRGAILSKGPYDELLKPLSGGMVYLLMHLDKRGYSQRALGPILGHFQTGKPAEKITAKERVPWAKAAQYACQCLFALGLVDKYGGDEYVVTSLGRSLLRSERMKELHGTALTHAMVTKLPGIYGTGAGSGGAGE